MQPTDPYIVTEPDLQTPSRATETGPSRMAPTTVAWFAALLGWTTLLSFYHLGGGAGFEPTDCWVAQTAREMSESKDWRGYVVPTFSGETRLQKSPGPYWAVILVSALRGSPVDEVSVRIPNAIFAILMVATVFWLARRIAGERAAIFAGFAASGCVMILHWSHRGASDLGVATLMTVSLASLWAALETEPPGRKRVALLLLGYFTAGLAMLYKMPMPLVCVGLPAFLYVLLCNRWRVFRNWWHLAGLALFLLPWVPWVIALINVEPMAWTKWRVEFLDRLTGDLPNVQEQQTDWRMYFFYIGVAFVFSVPFCLSIPQAVARAFRRHADVNRRGTWFLLIWFFSLLAFFTVAAGKESRYFLPVMPPLLIMLGMELSAFFDPKRAARPALDRLGLGAVWILLPAGFAGAGFYLRYWYAKKAELGLPPWETLWPALLVAAALLTVGVMVSAWLYYRRKEHASFAALVGMMWLTWFWAWPNVMPIMASQAPFKDFAEQLKELAPEHRQRLRQIAQQDSRIVWYGDVRFPRIIDQLELLQWQDGERDIEREKRIVGEEMVAQLEGYELVLLVSNPSDYVEFHVRASLALQAQGGEMPPTHVWRIARVGPYKHRYVLYGNQRPPWPEPDAAWLDELVARSITKHKQRLADEPELQPDATPNAGDD